MEPSLQKPPPTGGFKAERPRPLDGVGGNVSVRAANMFIGSRRTAAEQEPAFDLRAEKHHLLPKPASETLRFALFGH